MLLWFCVATYLLLINALTFLVWAIDKERARRQALRVSEQSLLLLAAFGGLGGAVLGQTYFRHKLRKRSFSNALWSIAIIEIAGLLWIAYWLVSSSSGPPAELSVP